MSPVVLARRASVAGEARPRAERIEKCLKRYPARYAGAVRSLAARHFALADLASSFPALLFALAVPRNAETARLAVEAVCAGASLRAAANEIGLPMWMRGLPPEAFARRIGEFPDNALFARRIVNHLPRSPKRAAAWLEAVEEAARCGDENVAVWIAREFERGPRAVDLKRLKLVCLWAWMSTGRRSPASALCRKRWSPQRKFANAIIEAVDWLDSVLTTCTLGEEGVANGWLAPAHLNGFEFEPLLTAEQVIEQARVMRNCVRTYAHRMRRDAIRLWRVRKGDEIVATLELGAIRRGGRIVSLRQASSSKNGPLTVEVERVIHEWLRAQPLFEGVANNQRTKPDRKTWIAFWRPYWLEKRRIPDWLPLSPDFNALYRLGW